MKANEFVKKYGWEAAKQKIDFLENRSTNKSESKIAMLKDLKTLVDAYELVQFYHGLGVAKNINYGEFIPDHVVSEIKQAVELVESCQ